MNIIELKTERLLLRQWRSEDYTAFSKMNEEPDVMEFYPATLTQKESDAMADKIKNLIEKNGWGFWAVELIDESQFIGFVGLYEPAYILPVTPCVEIGWRLDKNYWGKGYATEAAMAALNFGFSELDLKEIFSFTSINNFKSRAVMERLNMYNTNQNFEHPIIPENNPLREHVLYKIDKDDWLKSHERK